jgi:hypothetical protein
MKDPYFFRASAVTSSWADWTGRNRRGRIVRHSQESSEVVKENPDFTAWVLPAMANRGSDPA